MDVYLNNAQQLKCARKFVYDTRGRLHCNFFLGTTELSRPKFTRICNKNFHHQGALSKNHYG